MSDAGRLLAEFDELIRTAPRYDTAHHTTPENLSWLGRVVAVANDWHSARGMLARQYAGQLRKPSAMDVDEGYNLLMTLLYEGRHVMQMATGTTGVAVAQGMQFDYFDEIRKKIEEARQDLLFVDPYLDAEFVSRYLVNVAPSVTVRLLTSEKKLLSLVSALKPLAQQKKLRIEVRTMDGLHDRYFFIDKKSCFQSGASFKDGAKNAPTTITKITDVFSAVQSEYEARWIKAKSQAV
jgi:hypothetical protein